MNGSGLRPIAAEWEWQESAACRGAASACFFSPYGERGLARQLREVRARQICAGCPVRDECARFALEIGEEHGVWGGTTGRERVALLRRSKSRTESRTESHTASPAPEANGPNSPDGPDSADGPDPSPQ